MGSSFNLFVISFATIFCLALTLECYSCTNQDSNKEKCVKTSKQCEQYHDACNSYIRWAIPPYWTPRGNRIHFISKDCDTQVNCAKKQKGLSSSCVRDWYLDWACMECCTGDLCNYYVTMGSSRIRIRLWTMVAASTLVLIANRIRVWKNHKFNVLFLSLKLIACCATKLYIVLYELYCMDDRLLKALLIYVYGDNNTGSSHWARPRDFETSSAKWAGRYWCRYSAQVKRLAFQILKNVLLCVAWEN
jgi:lymphocyte antigen 6 complex protein